MVETLTDAVSLWVIGLGPGVLDVIDRQVELIIMAFWFTAVLGTAVGQDSEQPHTLFCKER